MSGCAIVLSYDAPQDNGQKQSKHQSLKLLEHMDISDQETY